MCKRCGLCCRTIAKKNCWKQGIKIRALKPGHTEKILITDEQIEMLLKARKYQGEGCEMLVDNDCLIHKMLGYKFKPKCCKDYICEAKK